MSFQVGVNINGSEWNVQIPSGNSRLLPVVKLGINGIKEKQCYKAGTATFNTNNRKNNNNITLRN